MGRPQRKQGMKRAICGTVLILATGLDAPPGAAQAPGDFAPAWQEVSDLWRQQVEAQGVVGSSLAFLDPGGELLAFETYGLADEATGRPVTEETIYHWASITKTFTGIAILQLRDRGLLDLEDPILDYVPELSAVHDPFGRLGEITIRHL